MAELDPDTIKFSEFETLNTVTQNTYAVGVHEGDNVNFSMNSVGSYVNNSQVYPALADVSHPSGQTIIQAILGAGGGGGGASVAMGTTDPSASLGSNGDLYIKYDGTSYEVLAMFVKISGDWQEIETGGGEESQCGAFVDYTDLIATVTFTNGSASYTATTDCYAIIRGYYVDNTTAIQIKVDGVLERGSSRVGSAIETTTFVATSVLLKKGQTLTVENCLSTTNDNYIKIYGLQYSSPNLQPVIFSTTEREIGVWTDGKPLYEKTASVTIENSSAQTLITVSNAEYKRIEGFISSSSGVVPVPFNDGTSLYVPYTDSNDVKLAKSNARQGVGNTLVFTIQYTKSTDTAGSGTWTPQGVPAVHYSTDERIVGTWIDGSPVYEKTQYISALPSSIGDWVNYPHGISNFDRLISVSATAYNGNIPQQLNIPHVNAMAGTPTMVGQIAISVSETNIAFIVGNDRSSWEAYVTIRYTKSST